MTDNIYTATFTLQQEGLNGMVTPVLTFTPEVEDPSQAPAVFEYMARAYMDFLKTVNILDEQGNVIEEDYLDMDDIHVSKPSTQH